MLLSQLSGHLKQYSPRLGPKHVCSLQPCGPWILVTLSILAFLIYLYYRIFYLHILHIEYFPHVKMLATASYNQHSVAIVLHRNKPELNPNRYPLRDSGRTHHLQAKTRCIFSTKKQLYWRNPTRKPSSHLIPPLVLKDTFTTLANQPSIRYLLNPALNRYNTFTVSHPGG